MMSRATFQPLTWPELLALAGTPGELLGVVRDFIATWTPGEIAALPTDCKPPAKFFTAEDVVLFTFSLVEYQVKHGEEDPGVFRMASFFSEATRRVTQVMGHAPEQVAANETESGA